ncbi:MAG: response regulator [Ignavibacteriae bacterium]|nr:response regulator [Ignavibacteriota bacterium]
MEIKKRKILIIEDDASSRESLSTFLEEAGYEVISAVDGYEGLELMKSVNPDLVLTDNRLPKVNGIELACINESFNPKIPFIIISASDNLQDYIVNLSVKSFMQKPIDIMVLKETIENIFTN